MRFLYFYFTLLLCISPTVGSSQNWEALDIHDCEQIISATQFHQDHGPWIVVAGGLCPTDENYKKAQTIGYLLVKHGYSVVTEAGPGIMEAANAGAVRAEGTSLGFILKGEELNDHIPKDNCLQVSHISHRLEGMVGKASGCIVFPGGLGTVSECFFALDNFRYLEVPHPVVLRHGVLGAFSRVDEKLTLYAYMSGIFVPRRFIRGSCGHHFFSSQEPIV
ncbi:putative lysine decarboxylase family protein [Chlamydia abortus]|nr:putative exported protein [Chlamydia abortus]CED81519.1 putative exported protein [Chlamydia abortus]CEF16965.1 putative exported protein [Chlamydia abortus]SGA06010.1 putative lysine decarboxylase family protein [Chlamydia abortus]SGA18312.1 putative lysine decarboxylase family protein [Chlamydia abortus]